MRKTGVLVRFARKGVALPKIWETSMMRCEAKLGTAEQNARAEALISGYGITNPPNRICGIRMSGTHMTDWVGLRTSAETVRPSTTPMVPDRSRPRMRRPMVDRSTCGDGEARER